MELQQLKGAHVEHTFNTTNFICNMQYGDSGRIDDLLIDL
jgi:hypothetical protein